MRTAAGRTWVVDQKDPAKQKARAESKLWFCLEQRLLNDLVAEFSDGNYFLSSLRKFILLPLETTDKIRNSLRL